MTLDHCKQVQEVIFSHSFQLIFPCFSIIATVNRTVTQNHLGLLLNSKLDFQEHLKNTESKITRIIIVLRKLQKILLRIPITIIIYKAL